MIKYLFEFFFILLLCQWNTHHIYIYDGFNLKKKFENKYSGNEHNYLFCFIFNKSYFILVHYRYVQDDWFWSKLT